MDMHKNFAEWYRLVSIEPKGDVLKSRWAGVETWSVSLSADAVLETVRIFQGLPDVNPDHLFLGTQADNQKDRHAKGRYDTGSKHWTARKPERVPRGERHFAFGTSKLSPEQRAQVKSMYSRGEKLRVIAQAVGIALSTAALIGRGQTRTRRSA